MKSQNNTNYYLKQQLLLAVLIMFQTTIWQSSLNRFQSTFNQKFNFDFLYMLSQLPFQLQMILIFTILILGFGAILYMFISKNTSFIIQTFYVLHPICFQLCFNQMKECQSKLSFVFWILLIVFCQVILSLKIIFFSFYYNNSIKGFVAINTSYQMFLQAYMIITALLIWMFQVKIISNWTFLCLVFLLNFLKSGIYLKKICFQEVNLQYVALIGEFYSYLSLFPLVVAILFEQSIILLQWILIFSYMFLIVFKKNFLFICQLLQKKYVSVLFEQSNNRYLKKPKPELLSEMFHVKMRLLFNLLFDEKSYQNNFFSNEIKYQILSQDFYRINAQDNLDQQRVFFVKDLNKVYKQKYQQLQTKLQLQHKFQKIFQQKQLIQILKVSQKLCLFLCFNLPSRTNKYLYRLFYFSYLNQQNNKNNNIFFQTNRKISFHHLQSKLNRSQRRQKQIPFIFVKNNEISSSKKRNYFDCMEKQESFISSEYQTFSIYQMLIEQTSLLLQQFVSLNQNFLKLQQNIQANKFIVLSILDRKHKIRLKVQKNLQELKLLTSLNTNIIPIQIISINFLSKMVLEGHKFTSKFILRKDIQQLYRTTFSKNLQYFFKSKSYDPQKKLTVVCSGMKNFGTIEMHCSKFKKLFFNNVDNYKQKFEEKKKLNIEDFMLDIFKDKHKQIVKSRNIDENPIIFHTNSNMFLLSHGNQKVYQIKLQIYLYFSLTKNLQYVLSIKQTQLEKLAVLDDKNEKEFFSNFSQYKINLYKTKRLAIVYSSFSNFLSQIYQQTQLFNQKYTIAKKFKTQTENFSQKNIKIKQKLQSNAFLKQTSQMKSAQKQIKFKRFIQNSTSYNKKTLFLMVLCIIAIVSFVLIINFCTIKSKQQHHRNLRTKDTSFDIQNFFFLMNLKVFSNIMGLRLYTQELLKFQSSSDKESFIQDLIVSFQQMIDNFQQRNHQINETVNADNPLIPFIFYKKSNNFYPVNISFNFRNSLIITTTIQILDKFVQFDQINMNNYSESIKHPGYQSKLMLNRFISSIQGQYEDFFLPSGNLQYIMKIKTFQLQKTLSQLNQMNMIICFLFGFNVVLIIISSNVISSQTLQKFIKVLNLDQQLISFKQIKNHQQKLKINQFCSKTSLIKNISSQSIEKQDNLSSEKLSKQKKIVKQHEAKNMKIKYYEIYWIHYVIYCIFLLPLIAIWLSKTNVYYKNVEIQNTFTSSLNQFTDFVGLTLQNSNIIQRLFINQNSQVYLKNDFNNTVTKFEQHLNKIIRINKTDSLKVLLKKDFMQFSFYSICNQPTYQQDCYKILAQSGKCYMDLIGDLQSNFIKISNKFKSQSASTEEKFFLINQNLLKIYNLISQFQYASKVILEVVWENFETQVSSYLNQDNEVVVEQINLQPLMILFGVFISVLTIFGIYQIVNQLNVWLKQSLWMCQIWLQEQTKKEFNGRSRIQNPFLQEINQSQHHDLSLAQNEFLQSLIQE